MNAKPFLFETDFRRPQPSRASVQADGRFLVPSTMAAERATNPFLRSGEPALAAAVGLSETVDPATVFVALRSWKNRF